VKEGAKGPHVCKIHSALWALDRLDVTTDELKTGHYGKSTCAAVRAFKTRRNIINYAYETTVDDIVGKMTIAALDREMVYYEILRSRPDPSSYAMHVACYRPRVLR
jgi:hypothetical protein